MVDDGDPAADTEVVGHLDDVRGHPSLLDHGCDYFSFSNSPWTTNDLLPSHPSDLDDDELHLAPRLEARWTNIDPPDPFDCGH